MICINNNDEYNEKYVVNIWNINSSNKIHLVNSDDKYKRWDAEDELLDNYEIKCVSDWYHLGKYDFVVLDVIKVGCPNNLIVIYNFYDGIYSITYSDLFEKFEIRKIDGKRKFFIPKIELTLIFKK